MSQEVFKLKRVVILLQFIVTLILCRPFGSIIHDLANKYIDRYI